MCKFQIFSIASINNSISFHIKKENIDRQNIRLSTLKEVGEHTDVSLTSLARNHKDLHQ